MKRGLYKAKTLKGAEREVRRLRKQNAEYRKWNLQLLKVQADLFDEREQLAKLAADEPQFFNPLDAANAKDLRDNILRRLRP